MSILNFRYKVLFVFFLSLFFSSILNKFIIYLFNKYSILQPVRLGIPLNHEYKKKTPTMGGIVIIIVFLLFCFLYIKLNNFYIFWVFLCFIFNFIIGFVDDFLKIFIKNKQGLSIIQKIILQSCFSFFLIYLFLKYNNHILFNIPILNINLNFGCFNFLFLYFILVCLPNAVNLTDGLDGLVIIPLILNILFIMLLSFLSSNFYLSSYFKISYLSYAKNLIILCSVLLGSCISFLFYNFYPAKIFMGDVGSLSIGSLVGAMYIVLHKEFYLFFMGFLFFWEFFTVLLQVFFFKLFKKRVFLIAPIHHHYELKGFSEINIVLVFWFVSLIFFFISLLILIFNKNVYL